MQPWQIGQVARPEPGLRVVLAPNPSPMTHWGTNTFLLGEGDVAVIDPGPASAPHLAAILAALQPGERVSHIFVTHAHLDHSPLARPLADHSGAPVLAFGTATAGRSPRMARLAGLGGGEGVDHGFVPDVALAQGDCIVGKGWQLQAVHTPGHLGGHLCFGWGERLFTGDHVMGWAPSLVSPPDGDMTDYLQSLALLAAGPWRQGYAAHGAPIANLPARCAELLAHRRAREAAILAQLDHGPARLETLTRQIYADVAPALLAAASRNLLAHLVDLEHRNEIAASPDLSPQARFSRKRQG